MYEKVSMVMKPSKIYWTLGSRPRAEEVILSGFAAVSSINANTAHKERAKKANRIFASWDLSVDQFSYIRHSPSHKCSFPKIFLFILRYFSTFLIFFCFFFFHKKNSFFQTHYSIILAQILILPFYQYLYFFFSNSSKNF